MRKPIYSKKHALNGILAFFPVFQLLGFFWPKMIFFAKILGQEVARKWPKSGQKVVRKRLEKLSRNVRRSFPEIIARFWGGSFDIFTGTCFGRKFLIGDFKPVFAQNDQKWGKFDFRYFFSAQFHKPNTFFYSNFFSDFSKIKSC